MVPGRPIRFFIRSRDARDALDALLPVWFSQRAWKNLLLHSHHDEHFQQADVAERDLNHHGCPFGSNGCSGALKPTWCQRQALHP